MNEESIKRFIKIMREAIDELEKDLFKCDFVSKNEQDEEDVNSTITNYLRKMKIPSSIKGYDYIRDAVIMGINDPHVLKGQVTTVLYPTIAEKYGETNGGVERAIRHAIKMIWKDGDKEIMNQIFGYSLEKRPTNAVFISTIVEYYNIQKKD